MFIEIIIFFSIMGISYLTVEQIIERNLMKKIYKYLNEKNDKYYEEFLRFYDKNKKIKLKTKTNILHKINIKLDKAGIRRGIFINPITIIFISLICFLVVYFISFNFLKIAMLSFIIALPCTLMPVFIINTIGSLKSEKIERIFLNFLLQLKNYTKINNDIILAFDEVQTIEPLQSYVRSFLIEMKSGIKFEKAIENMKEKVDVLIFKNFLSNLEHCYLYGGSFTELIDKSYKIIKEIQTEKNSRMQETKSARIVLYILIFLNLFVYITYIKNNYENYIIMQKSFVGNFILYWNFISIWILIVLANKVKKLDY